MRVPRLRASTIVREGVVRPDWLVAERFFERALEIATDALG